MHSFIPRLFVFSNLKINKFLKLSKNFQFCNRQCICHNWIFNSTLSTEHQKFSHENNDTFGNLREPLEKSHENNLKNIRVIHIKKRPTSKRNSSANNFGSLSDKNCIWYPDILDEPKIDNEQSDDSYMVKNISRKYRDPKVYLERMKSLVKEKKLKEALDLFIEMKRNHVDRTHPHFTFMIGACGRFGFTEMAFKLLRQMTDRKMKPTSATLTGLFNSCAESPYPDYGLKKAKFLKEKIGLKNWKLTQITYHAMIKAFGKCGDIQTAFEIVDEMAANDIKIDAETYNFLLMSCITDKESGFTHAVEVWRKMKQRKCMPNEFSYNLLLRAARDCNIGPEEISCLLLQHWSNYLKRPYGFKVKEIKTIENQMLRIQSAEYVNDEKLQPSGEHNKKVLDDPIDCTKSSETVNKNFTENDVSDVIDAEKLNRNLAILTSTPSILGVRPTNLSYDLNLENIKTSSDRLMILGGFEGFLKEMKNNNTKPSIKTFTLLLDCLPPYFEMEEKLISLLDSYKVVPDIGFFNMLMKRRIFRHQSSAAKEVLLKINYYGLSPDIITFGILATGCRQYNQALNYINDLQKLGFHPNVEIIGALIGNACTIYDFKYLQHILELMEKDNIQPNKKILVKINNCLNVAKKNIINMEHKKEVLEIFKQNNFSKYYKEFSEFYEIWLRNMKFEKEENVWTQYETEIVEKYVEENY